MEIKTVIEGKDGDVEYTAFLNPEETKFVIEVGLNYLMKQGALPFTIVDEKTAASVVPASGQVQ